MDFCEPMGGTFQLKPKITSGIPHCQLDISIFDNFLSLFFFLTTLNLDFLRPVLGQRWPPSFGACGDASLAADLGCAKGTQGRTALVLRGSLSAPWQHRQVMISDDEGFSRWTYSLLQFPWNSQHKNIRTSLKLKAFAVEASRDSAWTWAFSLNSRQN